MINNSDFESLRLKLSTFETDGFQYSSTTLTKCLPFQVHGNHYRRNWRTQSIQTDTCMNRSNFDFESVISTHARSHAERALSHARTNEIICRKAYDRSLLSFTSCNFSYGRFISVYPVRIIGSNKLESSLNICTGFLCSSSSHFLADSFFPSIFLSFWINIILILVLIVCFHFGKYHYAWCIFGHNTFVYTMQAYTHSHIHKQSDNSMFWQASREM